MKPPAPTGWVVAWGALGDTTPARDALALVAENWHGVTSYSTPDAALAAARDASRRAVKELSPFVYRVCVVVRHGLRPRWLLVDGETWAVDENGKLGGRP